MPLPLPLIALLALQPATAPASAPTTRPAFRDVAGAAGIQVETAARSQLIDVDGDGFVDVIVNAPTFRVLLSTPGKDGAARTFVDRTDASGLNDRQHSQLLWGDLDNNGTLDVVSIVTQTAAQFAKEPQTYAVYLGDGHGKFTRLPTSGLEQPRHTATHAGVLADLDLDGKLDVAFGNQYDGDGLVAQPMRVFRGDGTGKFADVTEAWGFPTQTVAPGAAHAPRPLYGLTAADLNNDGYPELIGAAYGRQWNTVWMRTPERAVYDDIAAAVGVDGDAIRHGRYSDAVKQSQKARGIDRDDEPPFRTGGNTFALVPADFDNDGDLDLFSAEITHWWAGDSSDLSTLLVNELKEKGGLPVFERQLETLAEPDPETGRRDRPGRGLARDHDGQKPTNWNQGDLQAHWADLDNDGLLDLIVCESDYPQNRLRLFVQKPDHTFAERSREVGLVWPNCPGVAVGDFDNDGNLDLLATGSTTRWPQARPKPSLALFENTFAPPENGWLVVKVVGNGTTANRSGYGARVTLTTDDGRVQTREISGPYGHWSAQAEPGLAHFGLGRAKPTKLTVTWPDAKRTTTEAAVPNRNQRLTLTLP
jgi:hypothetical protein